MTATKNTNGTQTIEAAFGQLKELNEQVLSAARSAGTVSVDSYEKAVDRALELELKVAGLTRQEWLENLVEAQADFVREVMDSYAGAARSLLK